MKDDVQQSRNTAWGHLKYALFNDFYSAGDSQFRCLNTTTAQPRSGREPSSFPPPPRSALMGPRGQLRRPGMRLPRLSEISGSIVFDDDSFFRIGFKFHKYILKFIFTAFWVLKRVFHGVIFLSSAFHGRTLGMGSPPRLRTSFTSRCTVPCFPGSEPWM